MNWTDLAIAVIWLGVGTLVLAKRRWLVQNAIESGNVFFERLGIPQASESSRRIGAEIIATLLGVFLIFFGLLQVYAFVSGQKIFE